MKNTILHKSENGFSLMELLVSMICAAVLMLAVGVLSSMANSSFNKISSQQQIYNDISYGFKLMQNRVRGALGSVSKSTAPTTSWFNMSVSGTGTPEWLEVDKGAFGIYQSPGSTQKDFVYMSDKAADASVAANRETIFSVPDANLTLTVQCDCVRVSSTTYACSNPSCTNKPKSITMVLAGQKDNIPFDMESTIYRRNP